MLSLYTDVAFFYLSKIEEHSSEASVQERIRKIFIRALDDL